MPEPAQPISFRLPQGQVVEAHLVRLPDGAVQAFTAEQLVKLPADLRIEARDLAPAGEQE